MTILLPNSLNICFGCSKEPSQRDGSFEMVLLSTNNIILFWLTNKKNNFLVRTLIWRPANISYPENVIYFLHLQVHFRLDFIMEANIMYPDLSLYCLQYRLPKNINRMIEQKTKVVKH